MIRWSDEERAALEDERVQVLARLRFLDTVLSEPLSPGELLDETVRILRIADIPLAGRPGVPAPPPRVARAIADHLEHPDSVTVTESGPGDGAGSIGSDR